MHIFKETFDSIRLVIEKQSLLFLPWINYHVLSCGPDWCGPDWCGVPPPRGNCFGRQTCFCLVPDHHGENNSAVGLINHVNWRKLGWWKCAAAELNSCYHIFWGVKQRAHEMEETFSGKPRVPGYFYKGRELLTVCFLGWSPSQKTPHVSSFVL